jgi:hypothetical protein
MFFARVRAAELPHCSSFEVRLGQVVPELPPMAPGRSVQAEPEPAGRHRQLVPRLSRAGEPRLAGEEPDAVAAYNAERRRDYREAHPLPTRPCVVCGKLTTKRPNALVCSAECRRLRESEQGRIFRVLA